MTTAAMHLPMLNIEIPSSIIMAPHQSTTKLEIPRTVHRIIDPDIEEVALILSKQRLHKSKAGSTTAVTFCAVHALVLLPRPLQHAFVLVVFRV